MSRIEEIAKRLAARTQGEWEWWTSCSWRRMKVVGGERSVLEPTVARDGHPDLIVREGDMRFIANAPDDIDWLLRRNASLEAALRKAAEHLENDDLFWEAREARAVLKGKK